MRTLAALGLTATLVLGGGSLAWAQMTDAPGPWGSERGPGMMEHAWSAPSGGSGWYSMGFSVSGVTLTKEQAGQIAQAHLQALGNPNVRRGDVGEGNASFPVPLTTKDGSLVETLLVDRRTDWLRSVY